MARLYWKHELVPECYVTKGSQQAGLQYYRFYVDTDKVPDTPKKCQYIIFVVADRAYAARKHTYFSQGLRCAYDCVDYSETATGKQILLKDMLYG